MKFILKNIMKKTYKFIGISLIALVCVSCGKKAQDNAAVADTLQNVVTSVIDSVESDNGTSVDGVKVSGAENPKGGEGEVLTDLVNNRKPTVIDFNATWCKPCRTMTPIFHKLASEMGEEYNFVSIDIDKRPELAAKYNVQAVPTFIFLDADGKEGNRITGAVPESTLLDELKHPVWK